MSDILKHITNTLWNYLGSPWEEFTNEEKEKFEKGWSLLYYSFDELYNLILQYEGNFSLLSAKPFLKKDNVYFSLISTTESSLKLLELSEPPIEQIIPYNVIYFRKLSSVSSTNFERYFNGYDDFTNEEIVEKSNFIPNSIYYLTSSGLELINDKFWKTDPYIWNSYTINQDNFDFYET